MAKKKASVAQISDQERRRSYIKQTDVPACSLDEALRVPKAILENYAGKATSPFNVAKALNIEPKGRQFISLTGAAIAYDLIEGGAQASAISISKLAERILRPNPTEQADEVNARREAFLKPRVFSEFLRRYDGHPLPREDIARSVLIEMGVPGGKTDEVLARVLESAETTGLIEELKGKRYVHLEGITTAPSAQREEHEVSADPEAATQDEEPVPPRAEVRVPGRQPDEARRRRVFVTHGRNTTIVAPIKKLLEYGELEPVVSVERQSVSKPVPEKVMGEMRSCGAGIIHVEAEKIIIDKQDEEHVILNPNVLIEIGAAMAFYGRRFILLVREGVKLPSNLQGLYEVRYAGDSLDADVTIRLLEAIKEMKNYPLPEEQVTSQ